MTGLAEKFAAILTRKHDESFCDGATVLRLDWTEFRELAGVAKLTNSYLEEVNRRLARRDRKLIPLNDFLVVCYSQRLEYPSSNPVLSEK